MQALWNGYKAGAGLLPVWFVECWPADWAGAIILLQSVGCNLNPDIYAKLRFKVKAVIQTVDHKDSIRYLHVA